MTLSGWLMVLLSAGLQVAGTLLLREGIDRAGGFAEHVADIPQGLLRLASQPVFIIGFFFYVAAALVWFRVIATQPLSTAYPLLVSLTFVFVTVGAIFLFQESFSLIKVIGLAIIIAGVLIVGNA